MNDGHYESFVVRLWVREGVMARGEVTHASSGDSTRFVDFEALTRFLAARATPASPDQSTKVSHA